MSEDEVHHGTQRTVNIRPRPGETRDCLDPWYQPFIRTNGDVWPCCWFYEKLGNVNETPFDQLMNGEAFKELRRELLTGQLRKACFECPSRSVTRPHELLARLRVTQYSRQAGCPADLEETARETVES